MADKEGDSSDDRAPLEGRYANHFRVGHNALEFIIEFGQFYEDENVAKFHTRIITSPTYARELLDLIGDSVTAFEREYK